MTKISQIVPVAPVVVDTDLFEKERADGTSEQVTAAIIKDYVITDIPYFIMRSPNNHKWKFTVGDDGMLSQPGEDLGL